MLKSRQEAHMRVTAWKNGKHSSPGVYYGLSIPKVVRDRFFSRQWREVVLTQCHLA